MAGGLGDSAALQEGGGVKAAESGGRGSGTGRDREGFRSTYNPVWNEPLLVVVTSPAPPVTLEVLDWNRLVTPHTRTHSYTHPSPPHAP